jgi:hypothetical protein
MTKQKNIFELINETVDIDKRTEKLLKHCFGYKNCVRDEQCLRCRHYAACCYHVDPTTYRDTKENNFGNGQIEIIIYNQNFEHMWDNTRPADMDISRNFEVSKHDRYGIILLPKSKDATIDTLHKSILNCGRRAQDNFYGYALSNKWQYFFTLTFSSKEVDRTNDAEVKECWKIFCQKMDRKDPSFRYLCVPERHAKDGALHFHGFIWFEKYQFTLKPLEKTMPDGSQQPHLSKNGNQLFEVVSDWKYGRNTVSLFPQDEPQYAAVNYLIGYCTKEGNLGYNQKRYWASYKKLNKKETWYYNHAEAFISDPFNGMQIAKTDPKGRFTIYRNFNVSNAGEK